MKSNPLFVLSLLVALVPLLAACGGQQANPAGPTAFTITVRDDLNFDPATISVRAGEEVTLTFENTGTVAHSFNILKVDAELEHILEEAHDEDEMHNELIFEMHEIKPGESVTETFTAPEEPGDYTIVCLVPGFAGAGMDGTMRVTA